jgi:hypothetical protein
MKNTWVSTKVRCAMTCDEYGYYSRGATWGQPAERAGVASRVILNAHTWMTPGWSLLNGAGRLWGMQPQRCVCCTEDLRACVGCWAGEDKRAACERLNAACGRRTFSRKSGYCMSVIFIRTYMNGHAMGMPFEPSK